jgi:hypothetical protein
MLPSSIAWWNSDLKYRQQIIINNSMNNNTLTDYQIPINITYDTNMQPDFSDLRFTWYNFTDNSEVEIPYWIENKNNSNWAYVWVKIREIPANKSSIIYLYYGNLNVSTSSNATDTFILFENLNDNSLDNFDIICASGGWSINNGILTVLSSGDIGATIKSKYSYPIKNTLIETGMYKTVSSIGYCSPCTSCIPNGKSDSGFNYAWQNGNIICGDTPANGATYGTIYVSGGVSNYNQSRGISIQVNTSRMEGNFPYTDDIFRKNVWLAVNDFNSTFNVGELGSITLEGPIDNVNAHVMFSMRIAWGRCGGIGGFSIKDWIRIRKYSFPEPTYSFGPKETYQQLTLTITKLPHTINLNQSFNLTINATLNNAPLTTLTQDNFLLTIDNKPLTITDFINNLDGTYTLTTYIPYNLLGRHQITIQLTYNNSTVTNSSSIFAITHIPLDKLRKSLFIADNNWKNILSLVPLKLPTIISDTIDDRIIHYINQYWPMRIFIVGNVSGNTGGYEIVTYRITDYNDIPDLFYPNVTGVYAGNDKGKSIRASLIASILNKPLVFNISYADNNYKLYQNTTEEIENLYLQLMKNQNKNINYLIVSNYNPLSAIIAANKNAFILLTTATNPNTVYSNIVSTVNKLNSYGFYINNTEYLINGSYLLLMDNIKSFEREDPVEKQKLLGIINFNDPLDGNKFDSDLDYGDLNNDTLIDVAIGRLPNDNTIASLMFARAFNPNHKTALVAAEYLHQNWASILLYAGGGMWNGRTIAKTLEDQGYTVDRLVERRADPIRFLSDLTPTSIKDFLDTTKDISKKVAKYLGKTLAKIVSKILIVLKGMQYAEQSLEMYLEYDWKSISPDWAGALNYVITNFPLNVSNRTEVENFVVNLVGNYLWPKPWKTLNQSNLINSLPKKDIIYYEGRGNGSSWILPNVFPDDTGFLGYKEFINSLENYQYNGSNSFYPSDIPNIDSKIVWDNSDLAAKGDMLNSFLNKGSASFIGMSAINYAPFSSEIDTRFFKQGSTIGQSLIQAINEFADDAFVWDPFNLFTLSAIKSKTLRGFILYGDPSLIKDPIIEKQNYTQTTNCINSICTTNIIIPVSYNLVESNGSTTIETDADNHLLELFKPIIPLKNFEYFLPFDAVILSNSVTNSNVTYQNITLPTVNLLSHSGLNFTSNNISTELYPSEVYKLQINKTIDNRTRIKLVHAVIQYNQSNLTATVFTTINLTLTYISPLEFSASANDILLGQTVSIPITIWSNVSDNAKLYVTIENQTSSQTFTQDFILTEGTNNLSFSYTPQTPGNYQAKIILVKHDPIIVGPRIVTFKVNSDNIAPITYDNSDGNWHYVDQIITLTCVDDLSGCKQTLYCIDTIGACYPDTIYSSPITISCPDGNLCIYYLRYNSIDNFGNAEPIKTSNKIIIDKTRAKRLILNENKYVQNQVQSISNQTQETKNNTNVNKIQIPTETKPSTITGFFALFTEPTIIILILGILLVAVFVLFIVKFL